MKNELTFSIRELKSFARKKKIAEWEAPVIIANPRDWPVLSVRDGNHRHEALIRSGYKK